MSRPSLAAGLVFACLAGASTARADDAVDAETRARISFIQTRLDAGTAAAERWSYGWLGGFGGLSLVQVGAAFATPDNEFRKDFAVGAVASSFGILPFALFPFTPRFAAADLRALPEGTPAERMRKLARAEALLKKSAEAEQQGHSWLPHVAGIGVSVGFGCVLAAGYHRIRTGVLNSVIGIALTEFQIFTQPTAAIDDWNEYSNRAFGGPSRARGASIGLVAGPGGASLTGSF